LEKQTKKKVQKLSFPPALIKTLKIKIDKRNAYRVVVGKHKQGYLGILRRGKKDTSKHQRQQ
jgi:hypothetical protein